MTPDEFAIWFQQQRDNLARRTFRAANRRCGASREDVEDGLAIVALRVLSVGHYLSRVGGDPPLITSQDESRRGLFAAYLVTSAVNAACAEAHQLQRSRDEAEFVGGIENVAGAQKPDRIQTQDLAGVVSKCWSHLETDEQQAFRRRHCGWETEVTHSDRTERRIVLKAYQRLLECISRNHTTPFELLCLGGALFSLICCDPGVIDSFPGEVSP